MSRHFTVIDKLPSKPSLVTSMLVLLRLGRSKARFGPRAASRYECGCRHLAETDCRTNRCKVGLMVFSVRLSSGLYSLSTWCDRNDHLCSWSSAPVPRSWFLWTSFRMLVRVGPYVSNFRHVGLCYLKDESEPLWPLFGPRLCTVKS